MSVGVESHVPTALFRGGKRCSFFLRNRKTFRLLNRTVSAVSRLPRITPTAEHRFSFSSKMADMAEKAEKTYLDEVTGEHISKRFVCISVLGQ